MVEIPFIMTLYTGNVVVGTARINVVKNPFKDVDEDDYYFSAVMWAYYNGFTTGTTSTTFEPDRTLTRAEVVTLLWRVNGKPEPTTKTNPFTDVSSSSYYYKAVLWAVEKGIVTGTSATTFTPNRTCSNAEVFTLLWRSNGKPAAATTGTEYYATAYAWATANNLYAELKDTFVITDPCPRADVMTYMYRNLAF